MIVNSVFIKMAKTNKIIKKTLKDDMTKKMQIVNMVVTSDLKHMLNLEKIASVIHSTEYNPEQFPGLVMRIKSPKTSALLFSSGKIVCTGAKRLSEAGDAIKKIIEKLKRVNLNIKIKPELHVQNMVASGELGFDLKLNKLVMKLRNVEYEPEQFPGLIYKIKKPNASFLLFSNGKLVCTGVKSEEEVKVAVENLIKTLKKLN